MILALLVLAQTAHASLPPAIPQKAWTRELRLTLGAGGKIDSCTVERVGAAGVFDDMCKAAAQLPAAQLAALRGDAKGPVRIVVQAVHAVAGATPPKALAEPKDFRPIGRLEASFRVNGQGDSLGCSTATQNLVLAGTRGGCALDLRYAPGAAAGAETSLTVTIWTDGDPVFPALLPNLVPVGMAAAQAPRSVTPRTPPPPPRPREPTI